MSDYNKQEVIGRLGKDPELKTGPSGKKYTFLSVGTSDYVGKETDGTAKYETTWHDITVFDHNAEYVTKHAKKGSTVFIEGRTQKTKKADSNEYQTRVLANTVIVLAASNKVVEEGTEPGVSSETRTATKQASKPVTSQPAAQTVADKAVEEDTDLPF